MARSTRGRPTEEGAPVTEALRFRVTPGELAGLKAVAAREGVTVSCLLRRAAREIVTGGPEFFGDATVQMSELARELAAIQRHLMRIETGKHARDEYRETLERLHVAVMATRAGFAEQVRRSRSRWAPVQGATLKGRGRTS